MPAEDRPGRDRKTQLTMMCSRHHGQQRREQGPISPVQLKANGATALAERDLPAPQQDLASFHAEERCAGFRHTGNGLARGDVVRAAR
jgi:hypothetical protein